MFIALLTKFCQSLTHVLFYTDKKGKIMRYLLILIMIFEITACSLPTERGQQYIDGRFRAPLQQVESVNTQVPYEPYRFEEQIEKVLLHSPRLSGQYEDLYTAIMDWSKDDGKLEDLSDYNIEIAQMSGDDHFGNVLFTGYFSPIIEVRKKPDARFRYPIYAKPDCRICPIRKDIYEGALDGQGLEIAYSASLLDNFLMEVQGSGFVHYGDLDKIEYFAYSGRNNRDYTSIGKVLIDRGEVAAKDMSMQAIKDWVAGHSEAQVRELFECNQSFIFFKRIETRDVTGSAGVPLVAGASVASDPELLPEGSVILAEVPQVNGKGQWTGFYKLQPMIALDKGGAVEGGHLDLYYGIGERAGLMAGFNKYYGRVWKLGLKESYSESPWEYKSKSDK